jgi:hypothetical protein
MCLKLQKISINVEKFYATHNTNDEYPKQLLGGGPSSLSPHDQQPVQTMSDCECVILMEERYGIRDEGILKRKRRSRYISLHSSRSLTPNSFKIYFCSAVTSVARSVEVSPTQRSLPGACYLQPPPPCSAKKRLRDERCKCVVHLIFCFRRGHHPLLE